MGDATNLLKLINKLITEEHYDGIGVLMQEKRNENIINENASSFIELCRKHLTDHNFEENSSLYFACENLLKDLSRICLLTEILFELLDIIDTANSDNIFTSALKGLQVCLLRDESDRKSLEWGLNEVISYIKGLKCPEYLIKGYDERQKQFLEQNEDIHRILISYITVTLFYEPILKKEIDNFIKDETYRSTEWDKANVLASFLLQLLGCPLALLDLSFKEKHKTNYHTLQCAKRITADLCKIFKNPYYLLDFVEQRCRWKSRLTKTEEISRMVFMNEEKFPLLSFGIFYYLLFCEGQMPADTPLIYNPEYIFESSLYLIVHLLMRDEPSLHNKAFILCKKILSFLNGLRIPATSLELKVSADFCVQMIKIIIYSEQEKLRRTGVYLLKKFILQFELEGQCIILKKLIETTKHSGLLGYFMNMFKNLVSEEIDLKNELKFFCTGSEFKYILLDLCCKLENGPETDLVQNSDQIITALNIIRYFAQRDNENLTGFWNFMDEIITKFLNPLRNGLNLSRAHFKAEEYRVQNDIVMDGENDLFEKFMINNENLPNFDKKQKLIILSQAMVTFDLMESLLARVNECLENNKRN